MSFIKDLFGIGPYPGHAKQEVDRLIEELIQIGKKDDFLSEHPGNGFNMQCRNIRARQIGQRLDELGSLELMEYAYVKVRRKVGKQTGSHLEYCWAQIGRWMP